MELADAAAEGRVDLEGIAALDDETAKRWQPYAGMIYFHRLLHGLAGTGEGT